MPERKRFFSIEAFPYVIWHSQKSTLYMQPCRFINFLAVWSIFLHFASTSNNQIQDIAPQGRRRDVSEETSIYQQPSGESPLSWKRKITLFFVFKITTQTTTTTAGWQGPYSCDRASRRPTAPQDFPGKDVRAAEKQGRWSKYSKWSIDKTSVFVEIGVLFTATKFDSSLGCCNFSNEIDSRAQKGWQQQSAFLQLVNGFLKLNGDCHKYMTRLWYSFWIFWKKDYSFL